MNDISLRRVLQGFGLPDESVNRLIEQQRRLLEPTNPNHPPGFAVLR